MRFILSLIVVLSLLVAPFVAQASMLCQDQHCASSVSVYKSAPDKTDSKSIAEADHCAAHCQSAYSGPVAQGGFLDLSESYKVAFFNADTLVGQEPSSLLRPPQAA